MSVLADPRHEKFAQFVASGLPFSRAYIEAGYKPSEPHASRLASNGKVKERVLEIQTAAGNRVMVDRAKVMSKLADIAFDDNEMTRDQLKSLELLGKELGMFTGREPLPGEEKNYTNERLAELLLKQGSKQ